MLLNLGDLVEVRARYFNDGREPEGGWNAWRWKDHQVVDPKLPALVISASHGGLNVMSGTHDQRVTLMDPDFRTCTVNPVTARVRLLNRFIDCIDLDVSGTMA